jgi:hypothetical protein
LAAAFPLPAIIQLLELRRTGRKIQYVSRCSSLEPKWLFLDAHDESETAI